MKEGEEKNKKKQIRIDRISKGTLSVTITIMEMRRWSHFRGEPSLRSRRVGRVGGGKGGQFVGLICKRAKLRPLRRLECRLKKMSLLSPRLTPNPLKCRRHILPVCRSDFSLVLFYLKRPEPAAC